MADRLCKKGEAGRSMKELAGYIRMNKKGMKGMLLWIGIFLAVFLLSGLPVAAVGYGLLLFVAVAGGGILLDFRRYVARRVRLAEEKKSVGISLEQLPEAENPLEERYQELLAELFRQKCQAKSEYDSRYTEMVDYYTMWVHQVKTPIAAMRLLLQAEDTPDKAELAEQLFKTEEYVGMVLQYLRIGDIGSDLKIRRYELDAIVRQAVRKYSSSFIHRRLGLDYQELGCQVVTDEKWLCFVVEQILSNAIKYTREGKISIYMDPARPKTLIIRDTGIGIEQEDLPRIFEKGFTGYNGRTDKKSTGIGLYLCKRIMNKLNHRLEITSEVGKGTQVALGLDSAKLEID